MPKRMSPHLQFGNPELQMLFNSVSQGKDIDPMLPSDVKGNASVSSTGKKITSQETEKLVILRRISLGDACGMGEI